MKILEMTVYAATNVNYREQLDFVNKFYTYERYEAEKGPKLGILEKFSSSLGFKDLDWHYVDGGSFEDSKVKSPKGYKSPYCMLISSMYFLNKENEYISFIVEDKDEKHTDSVYDYNTLDMLLKFQQFLYKIYGSLIRIEFKFRKQGKLDLKDWLVSHFYKVLAQGEHYDTECSVSRMLTKREKRYVLKVISNYASYIPDISQFYCETCAGYDKDNPYHTELVNKVIEKKWEEESIKNGTYMKDYLDI